MHLCFAPDTALDGKKQQNTENFDFHNVWFKFNLNTSGLLDNACWVRGTLRAEAKNRLGLKILWGCLDLVDSVGVRHEACFS